MKGKVKGITLLIVLFFMLFTVNSFAVEDTTWQNDYEYELATVDEDGFVGTTKINLGKEKVGEKYVILRRYIGTDTVEKVEAKAILNSEEYQTFLTSTYDYSKNIPSIWGETVIENLSFEDDVVLSTDLSYLFRKCKKLTVLDISNFDTSNVTDISCMFWDCEELTSIDVSKFDTSNVTDMSWMFYNCSKVIEIDVSNFDTSKVTNMKNMFYSCNN